MRVRERFLELSQLRIREGCSISALLSPRIVIHRAQLARRAAVVVREMAARMVMMVLQLMMMAAVRMIQRRWTYNGADRICAA